MPSNDRNNQPNVGPFTARQVYDNLPLLPGSQCIRVLDVHQSDPADSDRLTGTLRTVDLRTLPKFTALSYVWGVSSHHKIACNGCDINITQSCYEALTSLRQSCQSLTIWADAICINQEDDSEKEQQIVLMGSIYTLAETVYVWLGIGNTKIDQAAKYIGAISQFRLFPSEVPGSPRGNTQRSLSLFRRCIEIGRYALPLAFRNLCIEPLIAERYQRGTFLWYLHAMPYARLKYADRIESLSNLPFASQDVINALLDQTWLSRAWTFQEMTLATNPVLVCGRKSIPWLVMHQALTFIEHSATQALTDPVNGVVSEIQRLVHDEVSRSDSFKKWQALFDVWQTIPRHSRRSSYCLICHPGLQPQNHLVALAQAIRDRDSKWPHDRVYAIDSVLRRLGALPPTPDYHKPLGEVYRDAFVSLMEWNPTLITLLVDCGSRLSDAPSWVPDWSQKNKSWLPDSYIYHGVEKRPLTDQDFSPSVSGNMLSVKAASLGISCYCLTLEKGEDGELTSNEMTTNGKLVTNVQLMAEWALRIRKDTLVSTLHESIPWTIMLTLTGRSVPRSEVTSEQEDTFRRMFEIITQLGIEVDRVPGDTAAAATRALEAICQSEGCSKLFLDTCNQIAGRRGLLVSDNGLLGSGPVSMRKGDTIALIKCISVPMALRKIGEDYQVLGPVFIDGFMGIPTENLQSINLDWEIFRLV
ncbi:heterokaryon incompatibility protein [Fusarium circinatum]|uniref:Heterokaryon incompatibility protein n=1 Tax=Fusarium circinatum TaxID=48490 RepID=A0A8H5UEJ4_FUSCI|nr:heterokaryon incompatibility protein [Fusarium circinatum]